MVKVIDVRSLDFNLSTSILDIGLFTNFWRFSHQYIGVGSISILGGGNTSKANFSTWGEGIAKGTFIHIYPGMKIIKIKSKDLSEKSKYIHVILVQVSEVNEKRF